MITSPFRSALRRKVLLAGTVALLALPVAAQARVFVGVGIGVPGPYYYPPPVYAPPPVYYPPPAYAYSPPPAAVPAPPPVDYSPTGYGGTCYAGVYTCPAEQPAGSQCSCPGIGAPSYGTVH